MCKTIKENNGISCEVGNFVIFLIESLYYICYIMEINKYIYIKYKILKENKTYIKNMYMYMSMI